MAIDALRIARGVDGRCRCARRRFVVDVQNREVTCGQCGGRVDPFDACAELALDGHNLHEQTEALLQQRREIASWQPHRAALRALEKAMGKRRMVLVCPHCGTGMLPADIERMARSMASREIEERRRAEAGRVMPQ
ncbi:MAG: hypothetical protein KGK07_15655 [Chloroflexota bacterium]|nr:hypothetical protein [Chloroflexota bacterium]